MMSGDLKDAFNRIKPVCDILMVCPSPDTIGTFITRVTEQKKEIVQELQQYLLFPIITHIKSTEIENKYELQWRLVDAMRLVLEKIKTVNSYEMCMKIETSLIQLVFDNDKTGMIADVPEEVKFSVMRCLTTLMLKIDNKFREKLFKNQVPVLAQIIFVSVHLAKLEKHRALRLAAINCVTAHTATHEGITENYRISDRNLENQTVDMLASILPGVLAALQDVAMCSDNPGHAVIVAAVDAIHRILCLPMQDKFLPKKSDVTATDFAKMIRDKAKLSQDNTDVSSKEKNPKDVLKRSPEWYAMAGDKLTLITKSLVPLRTHEHFKVRKELGVFCSRLIMECNISMQPSVPIAMDILIALSKDEYPEVSEYCSSAVGAYLNSLNEVTKHKTMDSLCESFLGTLNSLPRILNNIDSNRKLSALNVVHGYIEVAPAALSAAPHTLCAALVAAAAMHTHPALLTRHCSRDVTSPPPTDSPWCKMRHLDTEACEKRFQEICQLLGNAECADLILDRLLELFLQQRDCELVYIMNWMVSAPNASEDLVKRILNTYLEEDLWYLPLEEGSEETPISTDETYDVTVYNPRAWTRDSVPDLYEGTVEYRYSDASEALARGPRALAPRAARRVVALGCELTAGVGRAAAALAARYQPYLLRTLCPVLERVGSQYEMLHLAGLKAINDIAQACGYASVAELIQNNADYFTNQITVRLKKAWNCQSALQILSVVMEYSDSSIFNCLYGIVEDVLVQSCDKYYEKDLHAYLQVFLTFVECVKKWFPCEENLDDTRKNNQEIDVLEDVREYIKNVDESERLLSNSEFEQETGKSVEEMYREDLKKREENELDYDDTVAEEKPPLPRHVTVTVTILRRCLNFVSSKNRDNAVLAMQVLEQGLPVLARCEAELLPLVHCAWPPLAAAFLARDPPVLRTAFDLLVAVAGLAKDFIRSRAVKEVLPHVYSFLQKSAKDSYLKDAGSAYRASAAFRLQQRALDALASLAARLALEDDALVDAMRCVDPYLSKNQPRPLQASAVDFFKQMLEYDYGGTWYHLRKLCNNEDLLEPPSMQNIKLDTVTGTPFRPVNKEFENNIKLIFENMVL